MSLIIVDIQRNGFETKKQSVLLATHKINGMAANRIRGISRTSLWNAWKQVRKLLRKSSLRDVTDFLEYDIDPDVWIQRLLKQIHDGTYEPRPPIRYTLGKSKGLSRRMTLPSIPDLVLYRTIADYLYSKAKGKEHKYVFFEVSELSRVKKNAVEMAQRQMKGMGSSYRLLSMSTFLAWLHYNQYRKYLILEKVYPYIVTTDITNFFDSILYSRIADSLYGSPTSPRMVGLLFFLLERLSIRDAYTESPRIGLPVDEFDCSRKLAHIVLFPHDDRTVSLVGEDAYVRWMDDQNIGVSSQSDGFKIIAAVSDSLARLHLTPNVQKTRLLSLREARRHFHLDINDLLDAADSMPYKTASEIKALRAEIRRIWKITKKHEGEGEWQKILKRFYRLAALAQSKIFRHRSVSDILEHPGLAYRIASYMRCISAVSEYIKFIEKVIFHDEQLYHDVNLAVFENILRLEPARPETSQIRKLASDLLKGKIRIPGASLCMTVAPLIILRFGDRRSLPLLRNCFQIKYRDLSTWAVKAAGVVYACHGMNEYHAFRNAASQLGTPHLIGMVRFFERVLDYDDVPGSYKARLNLRFDAISGKKFFDMRSIIAARILSLNRKRTINLWLNSKKNELLKSDISQYDKSMINRLL